MNLNNIYNKLDNLLKNNKSKYFFKEVQKYLIDGFVQIVNNPINNNYEIMYYKANPSIRLYKIYNKLHEAIELKAPVSSIKKNILIYTGLTSNDDNSINIIFYLIEKILLNQAKDKLLIKNTLDDYNIYIVMIISPRNYLLNIKSNINHNLEPLDKFIEKLTEEYILTNEKKINLSMLNKLTDHNLANDIHYYNFINNIDKKIKLKKTLTEYNYGLNNTGDESSGVVTLENRASCDKKEIEIKIEIDIEIINEVKILFEIIKKYEINHVIMLMDKEINEIYSNVNKDNIEIYNKFYNIFCENDTFIINDKFFLNNTNLVFENLINVTKSIVSFNNSDMLDLKYILIMYLIILN